MTSRDRGVVKEALGPEERMIARRRFQIRNEDVRKMRESPGCPGCRAVSGRGSNKIHSQECREISGDLLIEARDPRIEKRHAKVGGGNGSHRRKRRGN